MHMFTHTHTHTHTHIHTHTHTHMHTHTRTHTHTHTRVRTHTCTYNSQISLRKHPDYTVPGNSDCPVAVEPCLEKSTRRGEELINYIINPIPTNVL